MDFVSHHSRKKTSIIWHGDEVLDTLTVTSEALNLQITDIYPPLSAKKKKNQNISWMGSIFFCLLAGLLKIIGLLHSRIFSWCQLDHLILEGKGELNANEQMNADDEEEQEHLPTLLSVQVWGVRGGCKEKNGWMDGRMLEGWRRTLEWLHLTADWEGKQSGYSV